MMAAVILASSVMRYVVGAPLAFQEELVGLFFVALVFLSLPNCTMAHKHVRVTVVTEFLPGNWRKVAELTSLVLILIFSVVFASLTFDFAKLSYQIGALTEVGDIVLFPWMMLMPIGLGLMGLVALLQILRALVLWNTDFWKLDDDQASRI